MRSGLIALALLFVSSVAFSQPGAANRTLDVFTLDSVEHIVAAQGQGYFPVLHHIEDILFSVFRMGAGHLGRGGGLSIAWSMDGGVTWGDPSVVVDGPEDDRNPAVGVTRRGRILVAYHEQGSYDAAGNFEPSLGQARCKITYSDDAGMNWSSPQPLGIEGLKTCSPYGRIIRGPDGTLYMNVYGPYSTEIEGMQDVRDNRRDYAYLVESHDQGESWQNPRLIAPGHNETALYLFSKGHMIAIARTVSTQQLNVLHSTDFGQSWGSSMRLTDPMQHPADIVELSNGWLLLLYGDRSQQQKTIMGIISRDRGFSWGINQPVQFSRPRVGDFGYPSGVVLPSGELVIAYYWGGAPDQPQDGSAARLYLTRLDESEFLTAFQNQ